MVSRHLPAGIRRATRDRREASLATDAPSVSRHDFLRELNIVRPKALDTNAPSGLVWYPTTEGAVYWPFWSERLERVRRTHCRRGEKDFNLRYSAAKTLSG